MNVLSGKEIMGPSIMNKIQFVDNTYLLTKNSQVDKLKRITGENFNEIAVLFRRAALHSLRNLRCNLCSIICRVVSEGVVSLVRITQELLHSILRPSIDKINM